MTGCGLTIACVAGDDEPTAAEDDDSDGDGSLIDDDAFDEWERYIADTDCKVVDLGNACWIHKHFSEDIQTRQVGARLRFVGPPSSATRRDLCPRCVSRLG